MGEMGGRGMGYERECVCVCELKRTKIVNASFLNNRTTDIFFLSSHQLQIEKEEHNITHTVRTHREGKGVGGREEKRREEKRREDERERECVIHNDGSDVSL
jgi:hypothetical protein